MRADPSCAPASPTRLRLAAILAAALAASLLQASCAARGQPAATVALSAGSPAARAAAQAAGSPDPVAARLASWLRAQTTGAASAGEIDAVLHADPEWPERGALLAQLQQALAREPDDQVAARLCRSWQPRTLEALSRCAAALSAPGLLPPPGSIGPPLPLAREALPPVITEAARAAWAEGLDAPADERGFLTLFGRLPTPDDEHRRFDRQLSRGLLAGARRELPRLPAADRPLAAARLALLDGGPDADRRARALRGPAADDPRLLLDEARWLRRAARLDDALALWRRAAIGAEATAEPALQGLLAQERMTLSRDMLAAGRDADASFLARDELAADPTLRLDIDFLAGWIALRRLHDPVEATQHFARLVQATRAPITLGRGFYWLGRAQEARGDISAARHAWETASDYPTSFYGQLAALRLDGGQDPRLRRQLAALQDPVWSRQQAIELAGHELARAATLLVAWGDAHDAAAFVLRLDEQQDDAAWHAMAARLADRLGLPQAAVAIARRASRGGVVLPDSGWPAPYAPPPQPVLPPGLALSVMRQESSFDSRVVSPAGAHGLMQLMPATASRVAGGPLRPQALADPATNMRLGTTYLASLLARFGNVVPFAVAAYNAGPSRVQQWLQQPAAPIEAGPGPTTGAPDDGMIDWIELIPYPETRNYVERVMESQTLYRDRTRDVAAAELAWAQPQAR